MYRESIFIITLSTCLFLIVAIPPGPTGSVKVTAVPNSPVLELGESPHWDAEKQSLYFVDLLGTNVTLYRYDHKSAKFFSASILDEGVVQTGPSFLIPIEKTKNQFAVGIAHTVKIIEWNGVAATANVVSSLFEVEPWNGDKTRFNDGKCDPAGRFYGGTRSVKICNYATNVYGGLYEYSKDWGMKVESNHVKVSNGLAWDADLCVFYYVDSCTLTIRAFDWNPKRGPTYRDERIVYDYSKGDLISFIPDGMTIDTKGTLYNALLPVGVIAVVDPKEQSMTQIQIPALSTTAVTFGGPSVDILFVTTGKTIIEPFTGATIEDKSHPEAGKLFMVTGLNRQGKAGYKFNI